MEENVKDFILTSCVSWVSWVFFLSFPLSQASHGFPTEMESISTGMLMARSKSSGKNNPFRLWRLALNQDPKEPADSS